jgi:hypothetical protein
MINVKRAVRTAYYQLLNGNLTYTPPAGGATANCPVSESVEKLVDNYDAYVVMTNQDSQQQNTNNSWSSLERITLDITFKGTRVAKGVVDGIADQIFALLFTSPNQSTSLPVQSGCVIQNVVIETDGYIAYKPVNANYITRRIIVFSQLVTQ